MKLTFSPDAWSDYLFWQSQDKKTIRRINILLKDIMRSPYVGIGKPEPLKNNFTGFWSRRIDDCNRLVYAVDDENCYIVQCRGHYCND